MRRLASTTAAFLAAVVLAGCQPAAPPATPTSSPTSEPASTAPVPTPTYLCTPEAGGDEAPCSQLEYDEMKAKDELYAEAEAVYRQYWDEVVRIMRAGGVTKPTDVLLQTTDRFHLEYVVANLAQLVDDGAVARGDDPTIGWVRRLPGQSKGGSIVALSTCVDATGWGFYVDEKLTTPGGVAIDDLYFDRIDGRLKIIGADGREARSCD